VTAQWVATNSAVEELVVQLVDEPRLAMDTEFHRERTYYPRLALVQLAWPGGSALIDPLATDPKLLAPLLQSNTLFVLHAAQQDLDVLNHAVGEIPARMFDTQLAAGFLGYSTPSLVTLLAAELKVNVAKGDRLTDWLRRPLSDDQKTYAAADVDHLLALHDRLLIQLDGVGRLDWSAHACEELRVRPQGPGDPDSAWLRVKDARTLKARGRGAARALAAWRERRAMATDTPPRQVLSDLAILGIAQKMPKDETELSHARGVDDRHIRGGFAREILAAVERGANEPAEFPAAEGEELDRRLRPAVTLVSAWVSEVARREHIDTTLLATRSDLVEFLRGNDDARLAVGWRHDFLGADIKRIIDGRAALSYDGRGGLKLISVSPTAT
jgi:ribonuclease D